jgi:hypothetical protein
LPFAQGPLHSSRFAPVLICRPGCVPWNRDFINGDLGLAFKVAVSKAAIDDKLNRPEYRIPAAFEDPRRYLLGKTFLPSGSDKPDTKWFYVLCHRPKTMLQPWHHALDIWPGVECNESKPWTTRPASTLKVAMAVFRKPFRACDIPGETADCSDASQYH